MSASDVQIIHNNIWNTKNIFASLFYGNFECQQGHLIFILGTKTSSDYYIILVLEYELSVSKKEPMAACVLIYFRRQGIQISMYFY